MKKNRILFDDLSQPLHFILPIVLLVNALFFALSEYGVITFPVQGALRYLLFFSVLFMLFYGIRLYAYVNYVQWNKRGIWLRIKYSFLGKSLPFDRIDTVSIKEGILLINKFPEGQLEIDISHVVESDRQKLLDVFGKFVTIIST